MLSRSLLPALTLALLLLVSCQESTTTATTEAKDTAAAAPVRESDHESSLRAAAEKLAKAENEKDTATIFSLLDSSYAITARGRTFTSRAAFKSFVAGTDSNTSQPLDVKYNYDIDKIETGTKEPVWAGIERGTFENTATTPDGSYNRKVSGPYVRSWKLVNGQWKCYHYLVMAFTCEGPDCSE